MYKRTERRRLVKRLKMEDIAVGGRSRDYAKKLTYVCQMTLYVIV